MTSSQSLTKAAKVTAALLSFNGFRRSIRKNCRRFHPGRTATCPCLCCGDNLTLDSSILICTTVLFPMPSVSRKLFHLQVASACTIMTTHHNRNRTCGKVSQKKSPENGLHLDGRTIGRARFVAHFPDTFSDLFFGTCASFGRHALPILNLGLQRFEGQARAILECALLHPTTFSPSLDPLVPLSTFPPCAVDRAKGLSLIHI